MVRVGFEIENRFTSPLVLDLDRTSLVDVDTGGDGDGEFAPTTVDGETAVEPDAVALVELTFELPPGTEPADVRAFAVRWVLRGAASVDEYTAFRRDLRRFRRPYGYGYGFYTGFPLFYFRGPFGGAGRLCW